MDESLVRSINSESKIRYLFENLSNVAAAVGIVTMIITSYVNYIYKCECNEYYNLPAVYFEYDMFMPTCTIILLVLMYCMPLYFKFVDKTDLAAYFFSLVATIVSISICYAVIKSITFIDILPLRIMIYVILSCVNFIGSIHYVLEYNGSLVFYIVRCAINFVIIVFLVYILFIDNFPSHKRTYEVITCDDKNYAVLTMYQGKFIASEISVKDDTVIIDCSSSSFIDSISVDKYEYIRFKRIPKFYK